MIGERAAKGLRPFPPRPFGRYTLLAPLAMGGMGEIFLGRMEGAQGFEKLVVIKKILPQLAQEQDFVDRFVTEAKILVKLHHGSVGQVLDMGQIDGDYYIALEFVDGKDLRKVASRCRERNYPLPQGLALYVMGRVVDALAYAHRKKGDDDALLNLVHRDVSPQNLLVSYEGEVKVIDFGLAKSSLASGRTNPSVILGKFFYMSPEQAQHGTVDRRSDLYAAGIVLYELLAGKNPFDGVPQAEIITRVAHPKIEPLSSVVPGLSPNLDAVVMKALAPDPKDRFASAEEMRGRLMAVMLEIDPNAGPESMALFMRAVFATEYTQERKVFGSLREAAAGGGGGVAATVTRPKVVEPTETAGALAAARPALKSPSMAVTTTVDALPSPEEFAFPVNQPTAQRSTDPVRPMVVLPEPVEGHSGVTPTGPLGHTVPFAALSLPPEAFPPVTAPEAVQPWADGAASSSDPQEWLAPGGTRPAEESHTTPFAALTGELPADPVPTTSVTPLPSTGPNPIPAWDLPPSSALVGSPAPAAVAPAPSMAATLPPGPLPFSLPGIAAASSPGAPPPPPAAARSPNRAPSKVSNPRLPAAPKPAATASPKVVIAQDLMQPPPEEPAPKSGVEHLTTSPVIAVAPAGSGPPPSAPAAAAPAPPRSSGSLPTAPPGIPPSKTEPTAVNHARAGLFVALGIGLGLAILGLVAAVYHHLSP